ncbi:MAG: hypothetical protein AAF611_00290 [Bacteroidota bacterium]
MENFYFLFESAENWETWNEKGFLIGMLILFGFTFLFLTLYYIIFGRKTDRYASVGKWFLFGVINLLLVFIVTLLVEGFSVFAYDGFDNFEFEIWSFSLINMLYAFVFYFLFSLVFKRFSIHSKFYPVKF